MNLKRIFEIYEFAKLAHYKTFRKTGEPYIIHPISVAEIANNYGADEETICACLLHDVVEDEGISLDTIKNKWGEKIAFMVDGVTKIKGDKAATLEKVKNYSQKDKRVCIIKLADRIHNTNIILDDEDWKKKYIESNKFYIQLGKELGFDKMVIELEKANKKLEMLK